MLRDFEDEAVAAIVGFERVQNRGQFAVELDVDDGADDLRDAAGAGGGRGRRGRGGLLRRSRLLRRGLFGRSLLFRGGGGGHVLLPAFSASAPAMISKSRTEEPT